MSATATLTSTVSAAMKPLAASGGYKKDKLNYRRRRGDTLQIVNFQLSQGNSADEARCYVNIGVAFDAIYALTADRPPDVLEEHQAHHRARIEDLVKGAPPHWTVSASTDTVSLGAELGAALTTATAWLDAIDGPAAMLARAPLDVGAENYLRAQLHAALGDRDAALAAVRAGVAFFADRGATVEKALAQLRLQSLARGG
jgi:hypothetical protein